MKSTRSHERRKKYKSLNNRLRRITDKAREKWWDEQCAELEKHERQGKMDLLYRKVSKLTIRKRKKQNLRVRDKEGNVLTDSDKVRDRWKEYIEDLYGKNNKPQEEDMYLETDTEDDVKGPSILFSEFETALSEFKMERQKEKNGIPAELLKALGVKAEWSYMNDGATRRSTNFKIGLTV